MGRDEERFVGRCIDSLAGVVDEIVFLDTGSSDNTMSIVHAHAHNAAPFVRTAHFEWCDDFSAARNEAARHATGRWILSIDCDEHLEGTMAEPGRLKAELRAFEAESPDLWPRLFGKLPLFDIDPKTDERLSLSHHVRLYPRHPGIRYESPIHNRLVLRDELEGLGVGLLTFTSDQLRLLHKGYAPDVVKEKRKHERTARLLQKALAERRDGLNLYYLGRAQVQLGQLDRAIATLKESIAWFLDKGGHELNRAQGSWLYLLQAMGEVPRPPTEIRDEAIQALKLFPKSPDLWYEAGCAMLNAGEAEAAKGAFEQAEKLIPEAEANETSFLPYQVWELYTNQAKAFAALGMDDEGVLALQKAVAAGSPMAEYIEGFLNRGVPETVHAGMATIKRRLPQLESVLNSILPQVDRLTIHCDDYEPDELPEWVRNHPKIHTPKPVQNLWKDIGKFIGLGESGWDLFFTLDDDILYPSDYVQKLAETARRWPSALIGVHASDLPDRPFESFLREKIPYHFSDAAEEGKTDVLGTGTLCIPREAIEPVETFEAFLVHPGMADVDVARACQAFGITRIRVARPDAWLLPLADQGATLWDVGLEDDRFQTDLMRDAFALRWAHRAC
jgi:glycosyltransferase involved in cell wall biosynthesis